MTLWDIVAFFALGFLACMVVAFFMLLGMITWVWWMHRREL
jgi:hypothetical protein